MGWGVELGGERAQGAQGGRNFGKGAAMVAKQTNKSLRKHRIESDPITNGSREIRIRRKDTITEAVTRIHRMKWSLGGRIRGKKY